MTVKCTGFPEEVELTDYDKYDICEQHPDIIVYQEPYDEFNSAYSVHPYFYTENLYLNTDKLVLIPCFVLREIGVIDVQAR